jgi:hypothetical protein
MIQACLSSGAQRLLLAVVGPLKNASIKYGENLFKHTVRHPPDAPGLACMKIDGLHLFNHDESSYFRVVHYGYMEGKTPICVGYGTDDSKTRMLVEQGVAHNQGRAAASLLMARTRVEGNGNEVPFSGNVGFHLPHLPANWFPPIDFPGLAVIRYAFHQFFQALFAPYPPHGGYDYHPIPYGYIDVITNRNARVLKHLPGNAESLTVAPFLNLRDHV